MRLTIEQLRQAVRHACNSSLSHRAVARLAGISPNTVRSLRDRLSQRGEGWEQLRDLEDAVIQARFSSGAEGGSRRVAPNWASIHEQLQQRDVTLDLLWQEFRVGEPDSVSYAQFTRLYRAWRNQQKISMRQIHKPGDKLFVDFCGRTMPIVNPDTGEVSKAQVFVGTLGASGYLFATAVASQTIADWLHCHRLALEHLGGVPRYVVPDNLKAAVLRSSKDHIQLNPAYQELAEHYGFSIHPARPRRPQDKSLAEIGVQIVQRWVLARLRNHTFFSLEELNERLDYWMARLNERTTRTYPKSRLVRFQELDVPELQSLPAEPYAYSQWRYQIRVASDYHLEHNGHHYSVPFQYIHLLVDVRVNSDRLMVFQQRRQIASHALAQGVGVTTVPEHLPPQHRHQRDTQPEALLAWAKSIGPATYAYARRNLEERPDFANGLRAVIALQRDTRKEQLHDRLESACAYALELNCLGYGRLRSILRSGADRNRAAAPDIPVIEHSNLRGAAYYATQSGEHA